MNTDKTEAKLKGDQEKISFTVNFTMTKRWVPVFLGFLDKLRKNSDNGHSSLIGFYADGDGDFKVTPYLIKEKNEELWKEFEFDRWGKEKLLAHPVCKDVDCPALWCNSIEEVYDAG